MQAYHVAIVGGGPRGLSVLERLAALYRERRPAWSLHIHIIDPAEPGQGAHSAQQPDHLLTNTVAGQITLFADSSVRDAGPIEIGPSLLDWARDTGYRRVDDRFVRTSHDGAEIHENDYLPRAMLGSYLTHVYDRIVRTLPERVCVMHHRAAAEDIAPQADGRHRVVLAGGFPLVADCVVLAIGHSGNHASAEDEQFERQVNTHRSRNPKLRFFRSVEPIGVLREICAGARVCIQGMGLTAYDVMSELTVGRGGRFYTQGDARLGYRPSGREPHLILCSRQGVPFAARGVNQKGIGGLHRPVFFTRQRIDDLRARRREATGDARLDYQRDLWPILKREMCYVYDVTTAGEIPSEPERYAPSAASERTIAQMLLPLGSGRFPDASAYDAAVRRYIETDLSHAFGGNVRDPVKAASDVLRDVRDHVRYAVDYGGLNESSHRAFLRDVIPVMYRISAGAPKERNMELLALLDAGIASFGPGPNPDLLFASEHAQFVLRSSRLGRCAERHADVLVRARIDCTVYPEKQVWPLMRNMLRGGAVRPYMNGDFHPGGIDVDESQNVIGVDGRVHPNVWALGILVEGVNFCTYVLPRALVNSRFIQFSGRCALRLFAFLDATHARQPIPQLRLPVAELAQHASTDDARLAHSH